MNFLTPLRVKCVLLGILAAPTVAAGTDDGDGSPRTDDGWRHSLAAAAVWMPEVDLDAGGRTGLTSYHLRADARRRAGKSLTLRAGMYYDVHDRDFSGRDGFAALEPWNRTSRFGIAGSLSGRTMFGWSLGIRPFVTWSSESGDLSSDAMSYGTALAVVAGISRDQRFGAGVRVSRNLDDSTSVSPLVIVDWRIDENWTISNPHETNFTVPAGLEIGYRASDAWRFAVAGIYQSSEFRLDQQGVSPGGIGRNDGILSFLRVTRRWSSGLMVHAYFGAMFDGELTVENAEGIKVARSKYDTAPLAALSIEGSF